jgi:energy-coupling factor transport system permease protein
MTLGMTGFICLSGLIASGLADGNRRCCAALFLLLVLCARRRTLRPVSRFAYLLGTFAIPLFFIHGLLNAQFDLDGNLFGLPYRLSGFRFAYDLSSRLAIFVAAALSCLELSRSYVVDVLAGTRLPMSVAIVAAQALAIVGEIPRAARTILLAQRSRGVQTGPGPIRRLRALPAIVLPLVSRLLSEVEPRSLALVSRGFGAARMSAPPTQLVALHDVLFLPVLALGLVLIWAWQHA